MTVLEYELEFSLKKLFGKPVSIEIVDRVMLVMINGDPPMRINTGEYYHLNDALDIVKYVIEYLQKHYPERFL